MTKEEAYKTLKENLCTMCAYGSQNMESCDIRSCDNRDAIKVLEQEKPETITEFADRCRECGAKYGKLLKQESCKDAISRESLLLWLDDIKESAGKHVGFLLDVQRHIRSMPPVNPQPKWIPISKRLPEENKTVIVSTKYGVYPEARYTKEYGWEWAYESGADYWRELEDVIAWMPLPKQYEPQESEG